MSPKMDNETSSVLSVSLSAGNQTKMDNTMLDEHIERTYQPQERLRLAGLMY
jgi:hypothetical protein